MTLTDHFVLLSIPDGGAKQTLDLLVGEIRILPLWQQRERKKPALNEGSKQRGSWRDERAEVQTVQGKRWSALTSAMLSVCMVFLTY